MKKYPEGNKLVIKRKVEKSSFSTANAWREVGNSFMDFVDSRKLPLNVVVTIEVEEEQEFHEHSREDKPPHPSKKEMSKYLRR